MGPAHRRTPKTHRPVIYKITYPNGKIYVGQDLTGSISHFGSPNSALVAADLTEEACDLTIGTQILWKSETATDEEVDARENTAQSQFLEEGQRDTNLAHGRGLLLSQFLL